MHTINILKSHPYSANGYYNRGIVYVKFNLLEKAVDSYELAISLKNDFSSAYFNKGNALADLGKLQQAIEAFKRSLLIDNTDRGLLFLISEIYMKNLVKYQML